MSMAMDAIMWDTDHFVSRLATALMLMLVS